ncbi:MAG: glycosyltransferase [Bryobacterales bacterium]|nr:glycosyltransferase [Bryobacterales bacterium]
MTPLPALLLQTWHELKFDLGSPEDIDGFPWSAPISIVVLVLLCFLLWKARRNYMALPEAPAPVKAPGGQDVTVVIPARNEEANIAKCVAAFKDVRVIVVDDASTDRTATLAAGAGAEVLKAPPLPRGTVGKVNAIMAGAKAVTSDYILFVDADTRFQPGFATALSNYAYQERVSMVTCFPRQRCETFFEKMLMPYAFALYFSGVNARRIHDVKKPDVLANGQCLLFLRSAYEFLGGHILVQNSVVEDVALAQVVKRHRMATKVMRAEHAGEVRMYDSLGAIWRGFKKNSFRFLRLNPRTGVQVVLTSILLTSVLPLSFWLAWQEQWPIFGLLLAAPAALLAPWYGGFGRAWLYLPAAYLFQLIALDGMVTALLHLKTDWKGRKV